MLNIGKYTYGYNNIDIKRYHENDGHLIIGNFCSIASKVKVYLGGNHMLNWITTYPFHTLRSSWSKGKDIPCSFSKGDVVIGNGVWIGDSVTIMSGVKIGDGSVIASRSIVTKDIPPYSLVAGNPAVVKRKLFTQEQIEKLLVIKWWEWEDDKINDNIYLLCSDKIEEFLSKHYKQ